MAVMNKLATVGATLWPITVPHIICMFYQQIQIYYV